MFTKILGTKDDVKMEIVFFDDDTQLLHLTGTEPFCRKGLTIDDAKRILENAGFTYEITEK